MRICFSLFIVMLLFSCREKKNNAISSHQPKVVEAKGYVVPKDSMAVPKVVYVDESKLKKMPVGNPKVVPTNLNVHPAGTPRVVMIDVSKLRVISPGTDTFPLPETVHAIDSPFVAKQPKSIAALPFRMKDAVTCNIQYLDVDQGMNSSYVLSILEDKSGNLWFGTSGGGVSKYDGKSFTHYTKKEGLSNNTVWSILEDKSGNLWFGTDDGGVCKYDGKSFTHYTDKEGLSNNTVRSILEDKSGNLWFGTDGGGVSKYKPSLKEGQAGTFTHYTDKEGLNNNTVWSILEDRNGNLWLGTVGGGVSKFEPSQKEGQAGTFTHYTVKDGLSNNTVWSILEDKSGNLWFGTDGGGVSKYEPSKREGQSGTFTHYTNKEGLSNNTVLSILEDKSGNLWFGTKGGGVSKYEPSQSEGRAGTFTHYTDNEGLSNNTVWSILEDKSGNLWFGTIGGGVNKYDRKSFAHYTDKEGLSNNTILSILEDKSGNLWFGTYGGGVCKYEHSQREGRAETFTHYTDKEGLSNNTVWSILEDKSGNLWFGTDGGGVSKYEPSEREGQAGTFTHYTEKEGLSNNIVFSILEDKSGNLWFGTYGGGVSKYEPSQREGQAGTFTHYTEKEGLSNNIVYSILEDKSGNLWFGTDGGGVCKYNPYQKEGQAGTFTHYTDKEGLSSNTVWSILEDKSGNLWFGTDGGGVSIYDGCRVEEIEARIKKGETISEEDLHGLKKENGKLVKSFTHYTEKEGLSNNTVWSILEDKSGNLWLSTEKGLTCFIMHEGILSSTKLKRNKEIVNSQIMEFHKEDGLKAEDFFQNSVLLDSKNRIWWGNGKALSMVDMNNFEFNKKEPELQMDNIYINENFLDFRNLNEPVIDSTLVNESEDLKNIRFNNVSNFHNYPEGLELPYYLNHLTFHFSAIDWYAPHKIKYQYKLEGLDPDWSNLTSDNKADYRNIPFGKYTFKIKTIGSALKWSKTFEYSLVIHPPWWRTWLAYSVYLMLILMALYGYIKWRERALSQKQKELELKVDEATVVIRKQKEVVEEQKYLVEERNREILDSIEYAKRIQTAILPPPRVVKEFLKNSFILYLPKDIVAGDFYWMDTIQLADESISGLADELMNKSKDVLINGLADEANRQSADEKMSKLANQQNTNQLIYIAACDCTGHGVPGAMVSVVCNNALNRSLNEFGKRLPGEIFDKARELVLENFAKSDEEVKDGMDASLCAINLNNCSLMWSGANNPLWIYRNKDNAIEEIKADKQPIGKGYDSKPFTTHYIQMQEGDIIYLFTDGYADQFGGKKLKKLTKVKFKEFLLGINDLSMKDQRTALLNFHDQYRGKEEQVDDICVIGVKL